MVAIISELGARYIRALLHDPTIRLMSVTHAEALPGLPVLTRLVLPQGVLDFERNAPSNDIILIADTQVVLVREEHTPQGSTNAPETSPP